MAYFSYILLYAIIICIILYYKYRGYKIIYTLPVVLTVMEIGKILSFEYSFEKGYNGSNFFILLFIFIVSKKRNYLENNKVIFALLIAMSLYLFLRVNWFDDTINMITRMGNTYIIFYSIILGFLSFNKINDLVLLNKSFVVSIFLYNSFIVICTILRFTEKAYSGGFIYGINHFQYYYISIFLLLSPLIIYTNNNAKYPYKLNKPFLYLTIFVSYLIVSFSFMRTAWLIVIIGFISFLFFFKKNKKFVLTMSLSILAIIIIYTTIIELNLYKTREDRFSSSFEIQQEGRFLEYILVYEQINSSKSTLLFGTGQLFNAPDIYGSYERALHSTYSNIIYGGGYIGLLMFLAFLITIVIILYRISKNNINSSLYYYCKSSSFGVVISLFLAFFSANTTMGYGISYFVISFFYLGIFISYLQGKLEFEDKYILIKIGNH